MVRFWRACNASFRDLGVLVGSYSGRFRLAADSGGVGVAVLVDEHGAGVACGCGEWWCCDGEGADDVLPAAAGDAVFGGVGHGEGDGVVAGLVVDVAGGGGVEFGDLVLCPGRSGVCEADGVPVAVVPGVGGGGESHLGGAAEEGAVNNMGRCVGVEVGVETDDHPLVGLHCRGWLLWPEARNVGDCDRASLGFFYGWSPGDTLKTLEVTPRFFDAIESVIDRDVCRAVSVRLPLG